MLIEDEYGTADTIEVMSGHSTNTTELTEEAMCKLGHRNLVLIAPDMKP